MYALRYVVDFCSLLTNLSHRSQQPLSICINEIEIKNYALQHHMALANTSENDKHSLTHIRALCAHVNRAQCLRTQLQQQQNRSDGNLVSV